MLAFPVARTLLQMMVLTQFTCNIILPSSFLFLPFLLLFKSIRSASSNDKKETRKKLDTEIAFDTRECPSVQVNDLLFYFDKKNPTKKLEFDIRGLAFFLSLVPQHFMKYKLIYV